MNARAVIVPAPREDEECKWLVAWASTQRWHGFKLERLLILVPNGAYHGADRRAGAVVARKLREKGLVPGTFDYLLAIPDFKRRVAGLWLEMKRTRGGVVSEEQLIFMTSMQELGYQCEVARGWVEASEKILRYLKEWGT